MRSINVMQRCPWADATDALAYYVDDKLTAGDVFYTRLGSRIDVVNFSDANPITMLKPNVFIAWLKNIRLSSTKIYDKEMLEHLNSKL